eukprot:TRINITY_DN6075_c0_g1_i3.p1 TRINITY_DN6075_c0_g1~~TRINITY_DN6075_c0_g1_i3.p1  ORF type:complete len:258 (+),score=38.05 TRINITY_DN6075_c0_g1_i3:505-1278(+)
MQALEIPVGVVRKSRQILNIIRAIDFFLNAPADEKSGGSPKIFYQLNPVSIVKIHDTGAKLPALERMYYSPSEIKYPYLAVNIKSGVSYYHVDGPLSFKRVSGSPLGETTFMSMISLMTDFKSLDEAIDFAFKDGDSRKVDMTVGDIYGGDYSNIGLSKDALASSFGKMKDTSIKEYTDADSVKSLLVMMTLNIGQLALLNSSIENVDTIVICGCHITNPFYLQLLQTAISFWSGGSKKAVFAENVRYFGCLGSLIQ